MKRAEGSLFISLPVLFHVCIHRLAYGTRVLCISRYAYDVNITLHLLLLNTFRVCSFITLSALIKKNELNRLTLPFAARAESSMLSKESESSRGFNVFTLTRGKQQINVARCGGFQQPAKTPV